MSYSNQPDYKKTWLILLGIVVLILFALAGLQLASDGGAFPSIKWPN
ncbi:MAG: hypothetical protein WC808_01550 [Patescibacteria group bacterium]|jgi:hypothetical protein